MSRREGSKWKLLSSGRSTPAPHLVAIVCLLIASTCSAPLTAQESNGAGNPPKSDSTEEEIAAFQRKVAAVYDQVTAAVVRIEGKSGKVRAGGTGVIVSEDGLVLLPASLTRMEMTFQLDDGRKTTGKALGWSDEWRIGIAKLDGAGPWPHVELTKSSAALLGQPVVTFAYPTAVKASIVPHPLLSINWIERAAPGKWFMAPWIKDAVVWHGTAIAFDLEARLVGAMGEQWGDGAKTFTDADLIQTLFSDLSAGRNVDRLRLVPATRNRELDGQDAGTAESVAPAIKESALAASVQIRRQPGQKGWSGTIIAADGLIATCAHHFVMPGAKVTVSLSDGRDVAGVIVGINLICDIGLVRITDPGTYPHVAMGDSLQLKPGAACLFVGYGPVDSRARRPIVRESTVVSAKDGPWSHLLCTDPRTMFVGGDSGGGVFDSDGRLVAIHTGIGGVRDNDSTPQTNPRVELFHHHWDELRAGLPRSERSPLTAIESKLRSGADHARISVVEIREGKQRVAMGTIVSSDGRIVTKASALGEKPVCVLADGHEFSAGIERVSRELDLALLKIDATELRGVDWAKQDDLKVGSAVAIAAGDDNMAIGFVSHAPLSLPRERGSLRARIMDGNGGVEVAEFYDFPASREFASFGPQRLQKGDVILTMNDQPVRIVADIGKLLNIDQDDPIGIAGDPVSFSIERKGEKVAVRQLLGPPNWPRRAGQSPRSSGFRRLLSVSTFADQALCGGPVYDDGGHAVGIAIAWREKEWLCVLPSSDIARFLSE
jgi:serine protease Do